MIKVQRLNDSPEPQGSSDSEGDKTPPNKIKPDIRNPQHMVPKDDEKPKTLRKKRSHDSPEITSHNKISVTDFGLSLKLSPRGGPGTTALEVESKIIGEKPIFTVNGRRIYKSPPHNGGGSDLSKMILNSLTGVPMNTD